MIPNGSPKNRISLPIKQIAAAIPNPKLDLAAKRIAIKFKPAFNKRIIANMFFAIKDNIVGS